MSFEAGQAEWYALRAAAKKIKDGGTIPDSARTIIADLLHDEAATVEGCENFTDVFAVLLKQTSAGEARVRVQRNKDTGDMRFLGDNSANAIRLSKAILNARHDQSDRPTLRETVATTASQLQAYADTTEHPILAQDLSELASDLRDQLLNPDPVLALRDSLHAEALRDPSAQMPLSALVRRLDRALED